MQLRRVLVVDFDDAALVSTAAILRDAGLEVVAAGSVEQILHALAEGVPSVVLIEPALEGRDGFELCRSILESCEPAPTVLFGSATLRGKEPHYKARAVGAKMFVERPANDALLVQAIRRVIVASHGDAIAPAPAAAAAPEAKPAVAVEKRFEEWVGEAFGAHPPPAAEPRHPDGATARPVAAVDSRVGSRQSPLDRALAPERPSIPTASDPSHGSSGRDIGPVPQEPDRAVRAADRPAVRPAAPVTRDPTAGTARAPATATEPLAAAEPEIEPEPPPAAAPGELTTAARRPSQAPFWLVATALALSGVVVGGFVLLTPEERAPLRASRPLSTSPSSMPLRDARPETLAEDIAEAPTPDGPASLDPTTPGSPSRAERPLALEPAAIDAPTDRPRTRVSRELETPPPELVAPRVPAEPRREAPSPPAEALPGRRGEAPPPLPASAPGPVEPSVAVPTAGVTETAVESLDRPEPLPPVASPVDGGPPPATVEPRDRPLGDPSLAARPTPEPPPATLEPRDSPLGDPSPAATPAPEPPPEPLPVAISRVEPRLIIESRVEPRYPVVARRMGRGGVVVLQAEVGTDGRVREIEVVDEPAASFGFSRAAIAAVEQWRYVPGRENGVPAAAPITIEIEFRP